MKRVTLTSKHQITIPADMVRQLKLGPTRQLTIEQRGQEVVIKPDASLEDRFKNLWQKNQRLITRPLTDAEIKQARRDAHEQRADRLVKRLHQDDSNANSHH